MAELFKDLYSKQFYQQFSEALASALPSFNASEFMTMIYCDEFDGYELKQRMTHTANVMAHFLPDSFTQAMKKIEEIINFLEANGIREQSVEFMFIPEYVEKHGMDDFQESVAAFEFITQFTSCEFAVRPFIVKYKDKMLKQMTLWAAHEHHMVRRLASEGARPRLPWAMALPSLKEDPTQLLAILTALKNDSHEIVRRSVANNLNDISKDNPEVVIDVLKQWQGENKQVDALLKHACRTLLKQGNTEVLRLFGFDAAHFELTGFTIKTPQVTLGSDLQFSFHVKNTSKQERKVRLEYGLYYLKKNGDLARKVFKISERQFEAEESCTIERKQSFKLITTRKLYVGRHKLSIIINGRESETHEFELCE